MEAKDLSPPPTHYKLTLETPEGQKSGLSFSVRPSDGRSWNLHQASAVAHLDRLEEAMAALYRHEFSKLSGYLDNQTLPPKDHWSMKGYKPTVAEPNGWLSVKEAQAQNVCRVCKEPQGAKQREDGTVNGFLLGHGHEFAHEDCLTEEARAEMYRKIRSTGPHRMD